MADPNIPFHCPRCGEPLIYVTTEDDGTHVYICVSHHEYRLTPDGRFRAAFDSSSTK